MEPRMSEPEAFDLADTYVHLTDGPSASPVAVDAGFWSQLRERAELQGGRLVVMTREVEDWPSWEMHPAGDEVVCLLSGAVDLVLQLGSGERRVPLRGRGAVIVPQGVWHRTLVREPGDMLFITRGAGTEHRPA
jgi:mannose-6-phosphate isomerase-like protein (cupin superfamily)